MHMNKTKFERDSPLGYYHMTCIGKTKHTSQRGLFHTGTVEPFVEHVQILAPTT